MTRRPFRRGLRLGLLGGAAVAAVRVLQGRRSRPEPAAAAPWPPMPETVPDPKPAPVPVVDTAPVPVVDTALAPVVDTVPEPLVDVAVAPGPDPQPDRVAHPPADPPPVPVVKKATKRAAVAKRAPASRKPKPQAPWVESPDGTCPVTHPVKGKLKSQIFHVPGGLSYDRTHADRCYLDAATAEADGLRRSKR